MHPRDLYRVLYRNGPGDVFKRISDSPFEADSFADALVTFFETSPPSGLGQHCQYLVQNTETHNARLFKQVTKPQFMEL